MFRTVLLSIIRSFSLYAQQWYMSYRFADSLRAGSGRNCSIVVSTDIATNNHTGYGDCLCSHHNLYDIYHCCVYSEKLLMMDRGTVRNM